MRSKNTEAASGAGAAFVRGLKFNFHIPMIYSSAKLAAKAAAEHVGGLLIGSARW
jgi:hypothetical protein